MAQCASASAPGGAGGNGNRKRNPNDVSIVSEESESSSSEESTFSEDEDRQHIKHNKEQMRDLWNRLLNRSKKTRISKRKLAKKVQKYESKVAGK